jgi:transcription initiation factor TFIIIB Brf1 subunit/transcription initiation factor TFIIB
MCHCTATVSKLSLKAQTQGMRKVAHKRTHIDRQTDTHTHTHTHTHAYTRIHTQIKLEHMLNGYNLSKWQQDIEVSCGTHLSMFSRDTA